ncbi:hypothetical protein J4416_00600 [Candidatus Pacearchaeota archaeon]|nr:hypothetical protein [Candidatus Pacearchaeota archaeon]
MFRKYKLPNLKCLLDIRISEEIIEKLRDVGCEIYKTDLSRKPFNWKEILKLTNNESGLDITSNEALDPTTRFYDWMSYEDLKKFLIDPL